MPVIPFREWLPDQPDFGNPGATVATNVLPSANGYLPINTLSPSTDALDARARAAIQVRDKDLVTYQFAGDAGKLYQNIDNIWTDVSVGGGYSTATEEVWEFTPWKNKLLATNFTDNPQQITLGGSAFSNLTTAFKARHITAIRDFVVVANTDDSTDNEVPDRVRWSAFNDETDWTVSASTLSDYQDLKNAAIERIFGGEFGVIFQRNTIWRMTFVGAPTVFQFDEVLPGIGIISQGAAAQDGDTVYFLSNRGFFKIVNGSQVTPIGAEKVDRFVLGDINPDLLYRISAAVDPRSSRVFWAYPSLDSSSDPDKIVCYDPITDRWSLIEEDVQLIWARGFTGVTLDSIDGSGSPELVTNGGFDADSDWTKGTGWTIATGVASCDGTQIADSDLSQAVTLTNSWAHLVEFTVDNHSAGTVTPVVGGTAGTSRNSDGTYSEIITTSTADTVIIRADSDFVGDIDNVSAKTASIDDLSVSLDSSRWIGGPLLLGAFDTDNKAGFFDGDVMAGVIETQELELSAGQTTLLNAFRPLVDGGTVTAQVGTRDRQSDVYSYGSVLSLSSSGRFTCRENARFHRIRLNLSSLWTHAIGIQINPHEAKRSGFR